VIVDGLGRSRGDVAQNVGPVAFGFVGEHMNAEVQSFLDVRRSRSSVRAEIRWTAR
jgi:hypothetical protein